jgi:hypothetical protein
VTRIKSILAVGLPDGGLRVNWYELSMTDKNILVVGFGGPPCTGKTTLMKAFMDTEAFAFTRLYARGSQPVKGHFDGRTFVMGDYRPHEVGLFGGTDKLSMSVQPHAAALLKAAALGNFSVVDESAPRGVQPRAFVFEGDRLFNGSFIGEVRKLPSTASRFIVLHASAETKRTRRGTRGDKQSDAWLRGRESKYGNIGNTLGGIEHEAHEAEADTRHLVDWLRGEVAR